ncbi:hypothetical protein EPN81_03435 [Patescibacteria group bacterium]|nr:MAG: hypothetical protein EPN81_03435 [Patescibacteria group bacterium]
MPYLDEHTFEFEAEPDVEIHAHAREHGDVRNRLALQMLKQTRDSLSYVIQLLEEGDTVRATRHMVDFVSQKKFVEAELETGVGVRTIEGVFDGQGMVGADGMRYTIPENYASKSKLVEGDMLKLIVKADGSYVFKQIGPVERRRVAGILGLDPSTQEPIVQAGQDVYKVLAASVSYFKGIPGDEVVILVPNGGNSVWAAVERLNS